MAVLITRPSTPPSAVQSPSEPAHANITWIPNIDTANEAGGPVLAAALPAHEVLDTVEVVRMYKTCAVSPMFAVQALVAAEKVPTYLGVGGKVALPHHASKSALNMVGKLLSLDLAPRGIAVALIHPGFMRTEMTKNVGYDQYWDCGGGADIGTACAVLGPDLSMAIPLQLPWYMVAPSFLE
ncbi:hypothetical protein FB451DRAFT_1409863 [Mycena latifolia]|nr:hypothetical protein FB451DRAFT_1409863 [Mycena latifolia]